MKRADISAFEKITVQLESLHAELTMLAKKSPNDAVNAFKLKFVNTMLEQCNKLFSEKRPFGDFQAFSLDEIPSNSDVTLIISQYIECAETFRADNIWQDENDGLWYWRVDGRSDPPIRTARPKKLSK
jgi:hypothetical protein